MTAGGASVASLEAKPKAARGVPVSRVFELTGIESGDEERKKGFAERSLWAAQPHEGASKPVVNTCLCQSFRKPVRPFARHVLNIRRGRKNSLLVSQFLAYAITGRYSSLFASKFQMILAVLLARA